MFWKMVDLVFNLAIIVAVSVFFVLRWRRARRDRRAFLEKRDQLRNFLGSAGKKSS